MAWHRRIATQWRALAAAATLYARVSNAHHAHKQQVLSFAAVPRSLTRMRSLALYPTTHTGDAWKVVMLVVIAHSVANKIERPIIRIGLLLVVVEHIVLRDKVARDRVRS